MGTNIMAGRLVLLLAVSVLSIQGCRPKAKKSSDPAAETERAFDSRGVESFDNFVPVEKGQSDLDLGIEQVVQDEDLNKVLSQCGIDDLSDNTRETFSTIMKYKYKRIINAGIAIADVDLTSILNLRGTLGETTLDVGVEVGTLLGTSELGDVTETASITKRAEALAKTFRGPVTSYSAPRNANFSKEWKGILCSINAADRLKNTRGGYVTEVGFNPPYAPAISPIASKNRYEKELGEYRFFHNIEAKVTTTSNPLLTAGKTYLGSIFVEKIPAIKETVMGRIQGDTAFRVTNRFGSDAETLALGLHLWTEYYIDHSQKAFSAVIANVGDEETMHFIGTYKGTGETAAATVNYVSQIEGVLTRNCTSCHNSQAPARRNFVGYAKAKASGDLIKDRVLAGTMPPTGALSAADKKLVEDWARNGFPEQ